MKAYRSCLSSVIVGLSVESFVEESRKGEHKRICMAEI